MILLCLCTIHYDIVTVIQRHLQQQYTRDAANNNIRNSTSFQLKNKVTGVIPPAKHIDEVTIDNLLECISTSCRP